MRLSPTIISTVIKPRSHRNRFRYAGTGQQYRINDLDLGNLENLRYVKRMNEQLNTGDTPFLFDLPFFASFLCLFGSFASGYGEA